MEISVNKTTIILESMRDFSLQQTFDCGQCFRWDKIDVNTYAGVAYDKRLVAKQIDKETIELYTNAEDFKSIWYNYFDLMRDYTEIKNRVKYDNFLSKASEYGWGIRILQQEPWEALCSFIISQRNNIPKIKTSIRRLCEQFGNKIGVAETASYTFPTPGEIVYRAGEKGLVDIGLGYRARYVYQAASLIYSGKYNLKNLKMVGIDRAETELLNLNGVGPKVANCVLLFGLNYVSAFPIDVWIQRVIDDVYGGQLNITPFRDVAGIVQQYMFYYMRALYNK